MPVDQTRRTAIISAISRILREKRVEKGLSMTALATRAGLSQQSVSYVEREKRIPNLDTILRMTDAIGIDVIDVIRLARERASRKR